MDEKKKILVVDDEPFCLKILKRHLEYNDYEVITASDGGEAIEKTLSERPDLVLLDVMLPVLDGFEVCNRLKSDPDCREIPIIICSAKSEDRLTENNAGQYADDYLVKPIDIESLLGKLKDLLS